MTDDPANSLKRRYRAALALVAFLVLLNQLLVQPALLRLTMDPGVVNVAGRQRMLSQRLAKAALALERADDKTRPRHVLELDQVVTLWSRSHESLKQGNRAMSLPDGNRVAVQGALEGLEPLFVQMRDAARRLIDDAGSRKAGAWAPADIASILGAEGEYLERMDHVVGLLERESRERVGRMFWTGWVVAGLILLALAAIGRFIVRPALELIRRQLEELRRGRDELEDRVRERTRELEIATERHQAIVERFSHVARTTTIGEMATGLAHELNQPLGAIANYAEGCVAELSSPQPAVDEVKAALKKLVAAALRAGQIIDGIRRFVTRHEARRERFEPNRVVNEVEQILRDEATGRRVAMILELAHDLPWLYGDPVQIQQVLVNLVRNAFDAFDAIAATKPLKQMVFIQTKRVNSREVEFLVTDNGEGIDPERLGKVFDAYFSTRAGGLGLGLAISRTIIEAHHGRITVTSSPLVATTFRFKLPAGGNDDDGCTGLHRG
jgi:two-component system, LuxR family, sensor kinase FixL